MATKIRSSKAVKVAVQPIEKVEDQAEEEEVEEEEHRPIPVRIFLYLQLQNVENLPETKNKMKIELRQAKNTITKLEDRYTKDTTIDLTVFDVYKPTFSITMEQDSVEDLNIFSDNPLIITLFERIIIKTERIRAEESAEEHLMDEGEEEEDEYEYLNPLAQGHIDLLQFYSTKRILTSVETYLYPYNRSLKAGTCFTTWQFYTLLPLLKEIGFSNMAFFTFESLYNVQSKLVENSDDLVADFSIQSTIPNEEKQFDKVHLCTFRHFSEETIGTQNYHVKWETLKDMDMENIECLSLHSGNSINIYKLFRHVLGTEGVNFNFDNINYTDEALVCNSQHRYVLTEELAKNLEKVIAFDEHRILVEVYDQNTPERILLQGTQDLSVLIFPEVNACRFAVNLRPPPNLPFIYTAKIDPERPTFAIISICFLTPITAVPTKISSYNDAQTKALTLRTCRSMPKQAHQLSISNLCGQSYKFLDESMKHLIEYIIQNQITSVADAKNFLCCHKQNLTNRIMKLMSCDFNLRFPTKNVIEFNNLMPTVYKELCQRVYDILQNCNPQSMANCAGPTVTDEARALVFMSSAKFLYEVGQKALGDILQDKVAKIYGNNSALGFYVHIYYLELLNFESAKEYQLKPIGERFGPAELFLPILEIYIKYMEIRGTEKVYNEALEYVIESVRLIAPNHPQQLSNWILLYCLYKLCGYLPGMSYARWKYENLLPCASITMPAIPKSRWEIYNTYDCEFKTPRSKAFYRVFKLYTRLGMYAFAELVFRQLAGEISDMEAHLTASTFKILMNEIPKAGLQSRTFPTAKNATSEQAAKSRAHQAQINGHLQYACGAKETAVATYTNILNIDDLQEPEFFALGLLRCGLQMMEQKKYATAVRAFSKCSNLKALNLAANFFIGKSLYKLHELGNAERYFIECTKHKVHIPDVWGYLALINLKLRQNVKALELWKYAKINLQRDVSAEVYQELNEISYDDIILYLSNESQSVEACNVNGKY